MKRTVTITSVESKAAIREHLVEKYVQQNLPPLLPGQNKTSGMGRFNELYNEIECCAAETPVFGTVDIFSASHPRSSLNRVSVPVASRFIVFCTREAGKDYKVAWVSSLT
jgi:hypothetical protein